MKIIKSLLSFTLSFALVAATIPIVYADTPSVWQETRTITLVDENAPILEQSITEQPTTEAPATSEAESNQASENQTESLQEEKEEENKPPEYEVDIVWTNLNDPNITVEPVFAGGGVGTVDSVNSIIEGENNAKTKAIAGINGGYFDVNIDQQTFGSHIINGDVRHLGDIGSALTFDGMQNFDTLPLYIEIEGSINGQWDKPNNWHAWNINHFMDQQDAVLIFDKNYVGQKPPHNFTGIVVMDGVVRKIERGIFEIPVNGFLILANNPDFINKFKLGYHTDYRFNFYENNYSDNVTDTPKIDVSHIKSALGAGPILIKNGEIVADPVKEGFFESKINYTKAKRSFIGVNADNQLAMGVVWDVTMIELAEICKEIGLINAINLDGGGSSGLYFEGKYIDPPSRKVANAIVVKRHTDTNTHLIINHKEVFSDARVPVIQRDGKTFVLISSFVKGSDGRYAYSPLGQRAEILRYQKRFDFNLAEGTVTDGENQVTTEFIPADNTNDFYFDISAVEDLLGFNYYFNDDKDTLIIQIETLETQLQSAKNLTDQGRFMDAIEVYKRASLKDIKNITIISSIADIYLNHLNDYTNAKIYYEKALDLSVNDVYIKTQLGFTYLKLDDTDNAWQAFKQSIELRPDYAKAYYGAGLVKAHESVNNIAEAKRYFKLAIEHEIEGQDLADIKAYLTSH